MSNPMLYCSWKHILDNPHDSSWDCPAPVLRVSQHGPQSDASCSFYSLDWLVPQLLLELSCQVNKGSNLKVRRLHEGRVRLLRPVDVGCSEPSSFGPIAVPWMYCNKHHLQHAKLVSVTCCVLG